MVAKRHYSRAESREMFRKVKASREANALAEQAETLRRQTDPLEVAKNFLRQRGFLVFDHRLMEPGSELIVVGRNNLSRDELFALVKRIKARKRA